MLVSFLGLCISILAGAQGDHTDIQSVAINNYQNIIQSASNEAINLFNRDPSEVEQILHEFSQEISSSTIDLIQKIILNSNSFDPTEISQKISSAIENALTVIQRSQKNKKIDIDFIVIQIYDELKKILNQSIAEENETFALKEQLQNLFSRVFLSGLFEEISDDKQQNYKKSNQQIINLLQQQNIDAAIKKIKEFLSNNLQSEITQVILTSIQNKKLESILIPTIVKFYGEINTTNNNNINNNINYDIINNLSRALGAAYNEAPEDVTIFFGKIILQLQKYNQNSIFTHAFAEALSQKGQIMQLFKNSLNYAISEEGCTAVAQLLMDAKIIAKKQSNFNNNINIDINIINNDINNINNNNKKINSFEIFNDNIYSENSIAKCMQIADELFITVKILNLIEEPEEAFQIVLEAFENKQDAAIAMSVIRGLDAGLQNEVILLLNLIFLENQKYIPANQLSLVLSLVLSQREKNVAQIILQAIGKLKEGELGLISSAVNHAFSKGSEDMKSAFEFLLEQSVKFEICGLKKVLKEVFLMGNSENLLNTLQSNPKLEICIEEEFFSTGRDKNFNFVPKQENLTVQEKNFAKFVPQEEYLTMPDKNFDNLVLKEENLTMLSSSEQNYNDFILVPLFEVQNVEFSPSISILSEFTQQKIEQEQINSVPKQEMEKNETEIQQGEKNNGGNFIFMISPQFENPNANGENFQNIIINSSQISQNNINQQSLSPKFLNYTSNSETQEDEIKIDEMGEITISQNNYNLDVSKNIFLYNNQNIQNSIQMYDEDNVNLTQNNSANNTDPNSIVYNNSSTITNNNNVNINVNNNNNDIIYYNTSNKIIGNDDHVNFSIVDCDDVQPPGNFSCEKQAKWKKCDRSWMLAGKFCRKSCGLCQFSDQQIPQTEQQFQIRNLQPIIDQMSAKGDPENSGGTVDTNQPVKCDLDEQLLLKIAKQAVQEVLQINIQ